MLGRVIEYAKEYEYARYTSTLMQAWQVSISAITSAIIEAVRSGEPIPPLAAGDVFASTAIDEFSKEEVRRHRARGVTLGMFLGLVKYYRKSYLELVRQAGFDSDEERSCLAFLERFFDRFEVSYSVEWNSLSRDEVIGELQTQNRLVTNEKNKYLTIFESLSDPVILLDDEGRMENINQAASQVFQQLGLRATRYYDHHTVPEAFGWLADELEVFRRSDDQEMVLEKTVGTSLDDRHFQVKMKRMLDFSEKYRGIVLILDDVTERTKKEEYLTLNRAIQRWVDRLVNISRRISKMEGLEQILPLIGSSASDLLETRFAAVGLWNAGEQTFEVRYTVRDEGGVTASARHLCPEDPGSLDRECAARTLDRIGKELWESIGDLDPGEPADCLAMPLKLDGRLVGALWVGRSEPFTPSSMAVLESLANQAMIVIEHERLARRMQAQAVLEERTRIAREMHDGLAQILGFLNLEMQTLEALVRQDKREQTLAELQRARIRILEAQVEVRQDILNLRTALSHDRRAVPALKQHLQEFGLQTGVEVHVLDEVADRLSLSPTAEVQLVRVVQEALTNIRLHALATEVWARFTVVEDDLCVEVADNGVGFESSASSTRFGLQSMKERIRGVGGSLTIDSRPGEGTRLWLSVPLDAERGSLSVGA